MGIGNDPRGGGSSTTLPYAATWSTLLTGGGECTLERNPATMNAGIGAQDKLLRLVYMTAMRTETISQVRWYSGTTGAGATPTLIRFGVYSIDATTFAATLIASTVNDTTLFAATNTAYTRSFSASFTKTAGSIYALACLCVTAATAPTTPGMQSVTNTGATILGRLPRVSGSISAQTDLPSSYADASVSAYQSVLYAELLP